MNCRRVEKPGTLTNLQVTKRIATRRAQSYHAESEVALLEQPAGHIKGRCARYTLRVVAVRVEDSAAIEFGISEAASIVGVSAATLRAWEREGLIQPARTASGYRHFTLTDLEQLRSVRNVREVQGLNVPTIRPALSQSAPRSRSRGARRQQQHYHYTRQVRRLRLEHYLSAPP